MPLCAPLLVTAVAACLFTLSGCSTAPPKGTLPITGFKVESYLGKWYEIARLDHSFERGLTNVSAVYSREGSGDAIRVLNRGYNLEEKVWKEAKGIAKFEGSPETASLKVSFFRPFWGGYHVIALDKVHYQYALVAGPSRDYLWILARDRTLPKEVISKLLEVAKSEGFATEKLIWVPQDMD